MCLQRTWKFGQALRSMAKLCTSRSPDYLKHCNMSREDCNEDKGPHIYHKSRKFNQFSVWSVHLAAFAAGLILSGLGGEKLTETLLGLPVLIAMRTLMPRKSR